MDRSNPVEVLDLTAERELAAEGHVVGLNDGHSAAENKAGEEVVRRATEEATKANSSGPGAAPGECPVEPSVQSITPFPNIADLSAVATTCATANYVAAAIKSEWASNNRLPKGPITTPRADGEQRFQCTYHEVMSHHSDNVEGTATTCRGAGQALVSMQLRS